MIFLFAISSCGSEKENLKQNKLFTLLDTRETGIHFINRLHQTEDFNVYLYRNFYNGAGVGVGDFNNDGLTDVYFCGNQVDNQLYINKGNFQFEEIAEKAGVNCPDVWSTGVSIVDINGDGFQDIYVCKSGNPEGENRHNELFINNGDLTFTEKAMEYGIADKGLSSHAAFFDFDKDGDLDCYLLNNSFRSIDNYQLVKDQRKERDPEGGNKLYRNDGGHFTDVSEEAGIYGSIIGFGLGVTVGDVNKDGWQDIYVSNDFFEKDYLYINQKDGTFRECLEEQIREISMGSMGADMADINNDGYPEIYVTEMLPATYDRMKTKAVFASWGEYQFSLQQGYYHQFARNTLQLNNRNNTFSEIGRYAGVYASDWSWGALIADLDNDGFKDIFVANGIFRDLLDQDYLNFYSNPQNVREVISGKDGGILDLIEKMPSVKIPNCAFANNGDLTFIDKAKLWGLDIPSHSNGAAYSDLDNDGDLDLIVNNVNMPAFVYENHSDMENRHFLIADLTGTGMNSEAIGAQVYLYAGNRIFYQEKMPMRGFMSAVERRLHFGLGGVDHIDSLRVIWPDFRMTILKDIAANQTLTLRQEGATKTYEKSLVSHESILMNVTADSILSFRHKENDFVDFERDKLLLQSRSSEGPKTAIADVNGDGLEDVYICGARDQSGVLMIQSDRGFKKTFLPDHEKNTISEETDCLFFDADGDGDQDLYIACGGYELPGSSTGLIDRLYFNDGHGNFTNSGQILPSYLFQSTSCVRSADFDDDGDSDLFVGVRFKPFFYGMNVSSFLLENDGHGNFTNITPVKAEGLTDIGLVTDAAWVDVDGDKDKDLVVCGEWMPIEIFVNENGVLKKNTEKAGTGGTNGWWHTLKPVDIDNDGDMDLLAGNHGLNSIIKASPERPVRLYINDFDLNGSIEQILCAYHDSISYPMILRHDLVAQIPSLASKYPTYDAFKDQRIEDIFPAEILQKSIIKEAFHFESALFVNDGNGNFQMIPLPKEIQFSPVFAIHAEDLNGDNIPEIFTGGNQSRVKPEIGPYLSGYGAMLTLGGKGELEFIPGVRSGFSITGEIRDIKSVKYRNINLILVAKNNDFVEIFKAVRAVK